MVARRESYDDEEVYGGSSTTASPSVDQLVEEAIAPPPPPPAPPPPPPAPATTEDMLFYEQNTQLPTYTEPPLQPEESAAYSRLEANQAILDEINASLVSLPPVEEMMNFDTPGLAAYEAQFGELGGPLAPIIAQIAEQNSILNDLEGQLTAQDVNAFTSYAQVDAYNALYDQYAGGVDVLTGYGALFDNTYADLAQRGQDTLDQAQRDSEILTAMYEQPTDKRAEALLGTYGGTNYFDQLPPDMQALMRDGTITFGFEDGDVSIRMTEAAEAAIEAERVAYAAYQREAVQDFQRANLGFTTEDLQQFAGDPGFQEYLQEGMVSHAGVTRTDTRDSARTTTGSPYAFQTPVGGYQLMPMPDGTTQQARPNPYGGRPILAIEDYEALNIQPGRWGGGADSPLSRALSIRDTLKPDALMAPLGAALEGPMSTLGQIFGGQRVQAGMEALAFPGELAVSSAVNKAQSFADMARDPSLGNLGRLLLTQYAPTSAGELITAKTNADIVRFTPGSEAYEELREAHPWIVMGGEIIGDPLNLVTPVTWGRGALRAGQVRRAQPFATSTYITEAFASGNAVDTRFVNAVFSINADGITLIDSWKLRNGGERFSDVARRSGIAPSAVLADEFGARISVRLFAENPSRWGDVLNEEAGRLAEKAGVRLTDNALERINQELVNTRNLFPQQGQAFWDARGLQLRVIQDTPQWRAARNLVAPTAVSGPGLVDINDIPLNHLVARGYGPQDLLNRRWRGVLDQHGYSSTLRPAGPVWPATATQPLALPAGTRALTAAASGFPAAHLFPSDTPYALQVLQTVEKQTGRLPATWDEYWERFRKATNLQANEAFPPGMTVDQVAQSPMFRAYLTPDDPRVVGAGITLRSSARPATVDNLAKLQRLSMDRGRNLFDDLARPGVGEGQSFSNERAAWLLHNQPATTAQKNRLRTLAEKRKTKMTFDRLERLTSVDADDLISTMKGQQPKRTLDDIGRAYLDGRNNFTVWHEAGREELIKLETRALIGDLLTPIGEGRYAWTEAFAKAPSVAGQSWLRLGDSQIIDAFRTAPDYIKNLPSYGPLVREMGGLSRALADGPSQAVMEQFRYQLFSLIDDVSLLASPAESGYFLNWLRKQYTDSNSVKRWETTHGRARKAADLRRGPAELHRLSQAGTELAARTAERAMFQQQLDYIRAAFDAFTYGGPRGGVRRLDPNNLLRLDQQQRAARLTDFFKDHPNATRRDLEMALKEATFQGTDARMDWTKLSRFYNRTSQDIGLLNRQIEEFRVTANELAESLGYESIDDLSNFSLTAHVQNFAQRFQQNYNPDLSIKPTTPSGRAEWKQSSTVDVAFASGREAKQPAGLAERLTSDPPTTGKMRTVKGSWAGGHEERVGRAFATLKADPGGVSAEEVARRLVPPGIEAADNVSLAMMLYGQGQKAAAVAAGISERQLTRIRKAIDTELAETGVTRQQFDADAKTMWRAAEAVGSLVEEGGTPVVIRNGFVDVPPSMNRKVLESLEAATARPVAPAPKQIPGTQFPTDIQARAVGGALPPMVSGAPSWAGDNTARHQRVWKRVKELNLPLILGDDIGVTDQGMLYNVRTGQILQANLRDYIGIPERAGGSRYITTGSYLKRVGTGTFVEESSIAAVIDDLSRRPRVELESIALSASEDTVAPRVAREIQRLLSSEAAQARIDKLVAEQAADQRDPMLDFFKPRHDDSMGIVHPAFQQFSEIADFLDLQLRSNTAEVDRWMRTEGIESESIARFVRPKHQRPVVSVFSPHAQWAQQVDWEVSGKAFDEAHQLYSLSTQRGIDEVYGAQGRTFTPSQLSSLNKLGLVTDTGDFTAYVANTAADNAIWRAKAAGTYVDNPYELMRQEVDSIVRGTPEAQMLYGPMFDNSKQLQTWHKWARAKSHDGIQTNWDRLNERWAAETPHLSFSKMPEAVRKSIFTYKKGAPAVTKNLELLDRLMANDPAAWKSLKLGDAEKVQTQMWLDMISHNWEAELKPRFWDSVEGRYRQGIHVDDLDAAVFPKDSLEPYDIEYMAKRIGTAAGELEGLRIGFDPDSVNSMLKLQYGVKRYLGFFWMRMSPRYLVNNITGAYASNLVNMSRAGTAKSMRVNKRIMQSADNHNSSVHTPRVTHMSLPRTEFGMLSKRDLTQYSGLKKLGVRAAQSNYTPHNWIPALTDIVERDVRSRVWSQNYSLRYNQRWRDGLDGIEGLRPEVREGLKGSLEKADVARLLEEQNVPANQRYLVYRQHNAAHAEANFWAYDKTRETHRDYQHRTNFDHMLDHVSPLGFWTVKNLLFVSGTILDRPATILQAGRIYDQWSEQWEGMPDSYRRRLHLFKVPEGVPIYGGQDLWLRPDNMTNPAFYAMAGMVDGARRAYKRHEDTPMMERLLRSTQGAIGEGWEELGWRVGPQFEAVAALVARPELRKVADARTDGFYSKFLDSGVFPVIRPEGFRGSAIPLAGWEALPGMTTGDIRGSSTAVHVATLGQVDVGGNKPYTYFLGWSNQLMHGTPFSNMEYTRLGHQATNLMLSGEFGEVQTGTDEYGNTTYTISEEADARLKQVFLTLSQGDLEAMYADDDTRKVLDAYNYQAGQQAALSLTGSQFREYTDEAARLFNAREEYAKLKAEDDYIPTFGNVETRHKEVAAFNDRIQAAHDELQQQIEAADYDGERIAEVVADFDSAVKAVYDEALEAGLAVPQLTSKGPNSANTWAFGEWDAVTRTHKNAHAPWLPFAWNVAGDQDEMQEWISRDEAFDQRAAHAENIRMESTERRYRRGQTAPYFNEMDDIRAAHDTRLSELRTSNLPQNSIDALIYQEEQRSKQRIAAVYERAEEAGISLRGSGNRPYQTQAWYRYQERVAENPEHDLLAQIELGVPTHAAADRIGISEMTSLARKNDTVEAHTSWTMDQVIEALDLNPYLPDGTINPKFRKTDAQDNYYLDRQAWEQAVRNGTPDAIATYNALVDEMLATTVSTEKGDREAYELYARPISGKDWTAHVFNSMAPEAERYVADMQLAYETIEAAEGEDKGALIDQYRTRFGPDFYKSSPKKFQMDFDEVAETISNTFNALGDEEQKVFRAQWGGILTEITTEHGTVTVVDATKLKAPEAQAIGQAYGLEFPNTIVEYQTSAGRDAISETYYRLSSAQKKEWREAFASDEFAGFIQSKTSFDEDGNPYQFDSINVEALTPEQVGEVMKNFGITLSDDPNNLLYAADEDLTTVDAQMPAFARLMERAEFDKVTEAQIEDFKSGKQFLDDPDDQMSWRLYYEFRNAHPDMNNSIRETLEKSGMSRKDLFAALEDRTSEPNEALTMKEYIAALMELEKQYDMPRLWDKRSEFMLSEWGQSLLGRDPDFFANYVNDPEGQTSSSKGGSKGPSTGGSYRYGSSTKTQSSRVSTYSNPVKSIFQLDSAMLTGSAPDSAARMDVAVQVMDIIERQLERARLLPDEQFEFMVMMWTALVRRQLGDNPTLDAWRALLASFQRKPAAETEALAERPTEEPALADQPASQLEEEQADDDLSTV